MDPDQRQFLANAWPLIAVVLMASGILVKTVPLESKRPIDSERVKFAHAGRQDVEARLWEDPFIAMRYVKGRSPMERCSEALADRDHHPSTLQRSILRRSSRGWVTVLPVMVSGGPYFEDSEGRRRSRYAVVMALLNSGWRPSDEDKLGYVWTFESCDPNYWERRAPEILPYEWFVSAGQSQEAPRALLVLWVDEEALTRRPLAGIERIIERFVQGAPPCPSYDDDSIDSYDEELRKKLTTVCEPKETQRWQMSGCPWNAKKTQDVVHLFGDPIQGLPPLPWCDIRVIGPSTSSSLIELARDLARDLVQDFEWRLAWDLVQSLAQQRATPASKVDLLAMPSKRSAGDLSRQRATIDAAWLRFYSSGATTPVRDFNFQNISVTSWSNYYKNIDRRVANADFQKVLRNMLHNSFKSFGVTPLDTYKDLQELRERFKKRVIELTTTNDRLPEAFMEELNLREHFKKRVIELTTTDDKLPEAFMEELKRRLADATPFSRLPTRLNPKGEPLCGDTVVVISEGDTRYARSFRKFFQEYFKSNNFPHCTEEGRPRIHAVHYLRGLDGVQPEGTGTPVLSASPPSEPARTNTDAIFEQATLERADGPSQYDYLRRLAAYLVDLDRRDKQAGRNGVRAVGVLGNDMYDKILVLDALRDRFPKAVFFAADLDARLFGRKALRSTRNLIVASSYGLTLNPGIQGAVPPFRDTYQSGMYLSTLVALNHVVPQLSPADASSWFEAPQLFEIGRTRAVSLSKGSDTDCKTLDPEHCKNIRALDEWAGFSLWSDLTLMLKLIVTVTVAVVLGWLLFRRHARHCVITVLVVAVMLLVVIVVWQWIIWPEATSGTGEPFAWFEGVSIWPTKLLELLILLVTVGLLFYGRLRLRSDIDTVAQEFSLTRPTQVKSSGSGSNAGPWLEFLDRMRWWPSFKRVLVMTVLYFVFGIVLISLDWPFSPHRGWVSAWFNHILMLALLLGMMALLMTVLDAAEMTTRYFTHLGPHTPPMLQGEEPTSQEFQAGYVGEDTIRLWTRFHFAVRLASQVNRFIYLPFFPLLLGLPTRSSVFDAWNIPLPYVVLLGVSVLLAMRGALSLRRAAATLKSQILAELDSPMKHLELTAKLAQHSRSEEKDTTPAPTPDDIPPQIKADQLRQIVDEIRSVQEGPFRPWTQEPVVRALLIVSGWAGGISTLEFLFLR